MAHPLASSFEIQPLLFEKGKGPKGDATLEKKRGCSLIRAALINRGRLLKVVRTPRRGPPTRPFSFSLLFLFVILPSLRFLRPAKITRAEHDPTRYLLLILYPTSFVNYFKENMPAMAAIMLEAILMV